MTFLMVISPLDDEKKLVKALESIATQTVSGFSLTIVINGGDFQRISSLITRSISELIALRIIESQKTINLGPALNLGLEKIEEDITIRIDPDDICLPRRIELIHTELNKHEFDVMGSQIYEYDRENKNVYKRLYPIETSDIAKKMLLNNQLAHPSVFFKTKKIVDLGGYPDIYKHEDYALWLKCIKKGYSVVNSADFHILMDITNMHKRRSGVKSIRGEYQIASYKHKLYLYSDTKILFSLVLRVVYRLLPITIKKYFYLTLKKSVHSKEIAELILKNYIL